MTELLNNLSMFFLASAPYWGMFLGALALSLAFTPIVRGLAIRFGMVDAPSARRINKTPIPRGGGVAVYLASSAAICVFAHFSHIAMLGNAISDAKIYGLVAIGGVLCLAGLIDDKFGMPPVVKLLAQIAVAVAAHFICGVGFATMFPDIPAWLDAILTVGWIVGAINAFNLIDGLDGLASGLASIGTLGMIGALFFTKRGEMSLALFAFLGSCLGFLRYNFNPASVFLGDSGSMYIGFFLSSFALLVGTPKSLFVSVGVPLLAMGVPIFDTFLAIVRRTLRALLFREENREEGNRHVMQADTDHLHHRILRSFFSQRKAVFVLYAFATFLTLIGIGGIILEGRAVALFIVGFIVVIIVMFRDMRRIELWDAGRLMNTAAHSTEMPVRRRMHVLSVPLYIAADVLVLFIAWLLSSLGLGDHVGEEAMRRWMLVRIMPVLLCMVVFKVYATVWTRAQLSNYIRLVIAVFFGSLLSCAIILFVAEVPFLKMMQYTILFSMMSLLGMIAVRLVRQVVRDIFYSIDTGGLKNAPDVSRVLVYGAGLKYRTFRRDLVRAVPSTIRRIIVGIIDDDSLLRGKYIGGIKIHGTFDNVREIIASTRADAVVIACVLPPERMDEVVRTLKSCGVKATRWVQEEVPV